MARTFVYTGHGLKAVADAYNPMDPWAEWVQETETGDAAKLYEAVGWVYRCVNLRAQAISSLPFAVIRNDAEVEWPLADELPLLLYLTESSLCLRGAAYWLRQKNRVRLTGFRWLAASTITPRTSQEKGLEGFTRRIGGEDHSLTVDELIYFWMPGSEVEVGPGPAPGQVALTVAGVAKNANEFTSAFFERGAIPAVLLTVEGNPPDKELKRLEDWWKRLLSGVERAWETVAVRATVKPQVIGLPLKDLAMTELMQDVRQQIAVTFGIPQTLLEDAANFATAQSHRKSFYTETIIPEAGLIQAALNRQVFEPMGLRFAFRPEELKVMQEDEAARADALLKLVNAGMPLRLALETLGYDLAEEDWAEVGKTAEPRPPPQIQVVKMLPPGHIGAYAGRNGGTSEPNSLEVAMQADLDKWRRKVLRAVKAGKVALVDFESEFIATERMAAIRQALGEAEDANDVRAAFAGAPGLDAGMDADEYDDLLVVAEQYRQAADVFARVLGGNGRG